MRLLFCLVLFAVLCFLGIIQSSSADPRSARVVVLAGTGIPGSSAEGAPANASAINNPYGIIQSPGGEVIFCEIGNHRVRKINAEGRLFTLLGTGRAGYSGDGGPALEASANEPYEVRVDEEGTLYLVEMQNHIVRKVHGKTGVVTTIAGSGQAGFGGDGQLATLSKLNRPHSIQLHQGQLYICDIGNDRIRKVDLNTGRIETFAGTGKKETSPKAGPFKGIPLNGPRAIDFFGDTIWLALREGNSLYRLDPVSGLAQRMAGTGRSGFTGNGGPALEAQLSGPKGIAIGPDGWIYFADTESHSIRAYNPRRETVELIAGDGQKGDGPDGPALKCRFNRPHGIFVCPDGSLLVGDSENHKIRKIVFSSPR